MGKQANKTMIGGFVLGAVTLILAGVVIFGSGQFLKKTHRFVLYFSGSIKGLNVGAPVMFRGVKIGSVTDIVMRFDPDDLSVQIPVYIEMDPQRITMVRGHTHLLEYAQLMVERGMRAQLTVESLVTGQLMIALDFYPDKPLRLVGKGTESPEIPTIPSTMEELSRTIEKLPLEELAHKLTSAISGIERAVNAPEVGESIRTVNQTLKGIQALVENINNRIEPLASSIEESVRDYGKLARNADRQVEPLAKGIKETVGDTQKLVRNVDRRIAPLQSSIDSTAQAATAALVQAEKTLREIKGVTGKDSTLNYQLSNTLKELSSAARSIRVWADYLERHPEALIRGKGGPKGR
ncbi:MAG: MCE family protein [Desulfobacteraceae bacterium]|nr:MAG: MCE family protein [Desulfobacteraceae bacterium]